MRNLQGLGVGQEVTLYARSFCMRGTGPNMFTKDAAERIDQLSCSGRRSLRTNCRRGQNACTNVLNCFSK